jgi:hypothetical protein
VKTDAECSRANDELTEVGLQQDSTCEHFLSEGRQDEDKSMELRSEVDYVRVLDWKKAEVEDKRERHVKELVT